MTGSQQAAQERNGDGSRDISAAHCVLAERLIAQAGQWVLVIMAMLVTTPAAFGQFAIVFSVYAFWKSVGAAGLRAYLAQWSDNKRAADLAITYAIISAYTLSMLGAVGAGAIMVVLNNAGAAILALILSATMLIALPGSVLGAALRTDMPPLRHCLYRVGADSAGLVVGLALLVLGAGIVALPIALLVRESVRLGGAFMLRARPLRLRVGGIHHRDLMMTVRENFATDVIIQAARSGPVVIVALCLGVHAAGLFKAAEMLVFGLSALVFEPLRLFAWTAFREAAIIGVATRDRAQALAEESRFALPVVICCAAPVLLLAALMGGDVAHFAFGAAWSAWAPIAPLVVIFALGALLTAPAIADEPLLLMSDQIGASRKIALINAICALALFACLAPFGLLAAGGAYLATNMLTMSGAVWAQSRLAQAHWLAALKGSAPVIVAAACLIIAVISVSQLFDSVQAADWLRLFVTAATGAIAYAGTIMLMRPSFLRGA